MRAAHDAHATLAVGDEQCGQHRLKDQRATARGADVEGIVASEQTTGPERERARSELRTFDLRVADLRGGIDRREVLTHEAGPLTIRANVGDAKRLLRADGERQRRAQDLPAALAL